MTFARKGILVSAGRLAQTAAGMLATVLFARTLGSAGIGQYDLFQKVSLLAVTVAAMGFGNASVFFINHQKIPQTEVATSIFKFSVVMGAILSLIFAIGYQLSNEYFGNVSVATGVIYALGTGLLLISVLLRSLLVAGFRAKEMVVLDLVQPALLLAVGGLIASLHRLNAEAAMVVFAGCHFVSAGLTMKYVGGYINLATKFNWSLFRQMIVYGVQLAAANLMYLLLASLSVILLRYIHEDSFDAVGLYGRAMSITTMAVLVPMAMGPLLMARWAGLSGTDLPRQVEMAARLYATYGIAAAVGMITLGKYLLIILYGEEFATPEAVLALQILSVSAATIAVSGVYADFLAGIGKAIYTTWALTAAGVVTAVLCVCLIPKYWITGAAAATLAGNLVNMGICAYVCRRLHGVRPSQSWRITRDDVRYVWGALRKRGAAAQEQPQPQESLRP